MPNGHVTTGDVNAALRKRYCAPAYALFFEVANGTGGNIRRYCDALAMGLFPSRGLSMEGFEVKVSKSDWERERANPLKVEEGIYKYCDRWWIVAPKGIVPTYDLPRTWGLIEYADGELRQKIKAPDLEPLPMTRSFVAAVLRRAGEKSDAIVKQAIDKAMVDERARIDERVKQEVERRMRRAEEASKTLDNLEKHLGFSINEWDFGPEEVARGLRLIRDTKVVDRWGGGIDSLAEQLEKTAARLRKAKAEFDGAPAAREE